MDKDFIEFNDRKFPLHKEDKDKYLIFTCIKNENDYVIEFVDHYLNLGFDKVILCDNNDDNSVESVLEKYIADGTVEIFDCRGFDSFQVQMYSAFCGAHNYKWCGYFDCDEFLVLNSYSNVKDFLDTVVTDVISFNWLLFGNNGKYTKRSGTVQERFPKPFTPITYIKENCFIKSIVRGSTVFEGCWFNGSHTPIPKVEVTRSIGNEYYTTSTNLQQYPLKYKHGYIKHYYTKSFEEWIGKCTRGWPDGTPSLNVNRFFVLDNPIEVPSRIFEIGLFGDVCISESARQILKEYDVIEVYTTESNIYYLMGFTISCMKNTTNHTFMVTGDNIDDNTYNILFEYGWITGNRVIFANEGMQWNCFLKYNQGTSGTYYKYNLN